MTPMGIELVVQYSIYLRMQHEPAKPKVQLAEKAMSPISTTGLML